MDMTTLHSLGIIFSITLSVYVDCYYCSAHRVVIISAVERQMDMTTLHSLGIIFSITLSIYADCYYCLNH